MTESVIPSGGQPPNPQVPGSVADPAAAQGGQPASPNPVPANSGANDVAFKELQTKVETLTRQYEGSTKEALRLKEENDKLAKQLEESNRVTATAKTEEDFQKLVDQFGLKGAFDRVYGQELTSLKADVEGFKTEKASQVLASFESNHQGLRVNEVRVRFDAELAKLKGIYPLAEAMEKAYLLAGGKEAEKLPPSTPTTPAPAGDPQRIINNVGGAEGDSRPAPIVDNATKIQAQINDLQIRATQLQINGRVGESMTILAQIEDLKGQLGAKV